MVEDILIHISRYNNLSYNGYRANNLQSISNGLMQTRVLSVWRIFKCRYVPITGCDHDILKIWKCHSNPWSQCRKETGNLHMGMGMGIVHVVRQCLCMTQSSVRLLLQKSNVCHPRDTSLEILFFIFFQVYLGIKSCSGS